MSKAPAPCPLFVSIRDAIERMASGQERATSKTMMDLAAEAADAITRLLGNWPGGCAEDVRRADTAAEELRIPAFFNAIESALSRAERLDRRR